MDNVGEGRAQDTFPVKCRFVIKVLILNSECRVFYGLWDLIKTNNRALFAGIDFVEQYSARPVKDFCGLVDALVSDLLEGW